MGNELGVSINKPQVKGYVQAQAGNVVFAGGNNVADIGAKVGGIFQYKGLKVDGQIGAGTTFNAKLGADLNLKLDNRTSLEIGGSARIDREMKSSSFTSSYSAKAYYNFDGEEREIAFPEVKYETKYHKKNVTSEMHAGLNFKSRKGSFTVGAMMANRASLNKDITHHYNVDNKAEIVINSDNTDALINTYHDINNRCSNEHISAQATGFRDTDFMPNQITIEYKSEYKEDVTHKKPSSQLVAGAYAKGEYNLDHKGNTQLFGNASYLGNKSAGEVGIRFTF